MIFRCGYVLKPDSMHHPGYDPLDKINTDIYEITVEVNINIIIVLHFGLKYTYRTFNSTSKLDFNLSWKTKNNSSRNPTSK